MVKATLISVRKELEGYNPVSIAHQEFKAMLSSIINTDPQPADTIALLEDLREQLPADFAFSIENLSGPPKLYKILRDYLLVHNFAYRKHPDSNRIALGLIHSFLENEEQNLALENYKARSNTSPPPTNNVIQQVQNHNERPKQDDVIADRAIQDERRLANNLSSRTQKEDRFSGKIGEDIMQFLAEYDDLSKDFALSEDQKLKYFHLIFDDQAKRYYRESIANSVSTFKEARDMLVKHYNSPTRRDQVRTHLESLRLTSIQKKNNCSLQDALESLRDEITKLAPQGPEEYQSNRAMNEYLEKAIVGH